MRHQPVDEFTCANPTCRTAVESFKEDCDLDAIAETLLEFWAAKRELDYLQARDIHHNKWDRLALDKARIAYAAAAVAVCDLSDHVKRETYEVPVIPATRTDPACLGGDPECPACGSEEYVDTLHGPA